MTKRKRSNNTKKLWAIVKANGFKNLAELKKLRPNDIGLVRGPYNFCPYCGHTLKV